MSTRTRFASSNGQCPAGTKHLTGWHANVTCKDQLPGGTHHMLESIGQSPYVM
jgi:hypothetical protein